MWSVPQLDKGKAVPLQAWSGPAGSRKLRFPDFMTMAQDIDTLYLLTAIGLSPGTAVQYTFTHKQYIERYKTNNT